MNLTKSLSNCKNAPPGPQKCPKSSFRNGKKVLDTPFTTRYRMLK